MTTAILIIAAAAALAILIIAINALRHGLDAADRVIDEFLGAELREIERRRQAGRQSGFDAGWHGGGRR